MDEIIRCKKSYKMCAVKVRNAKLRNYLKLYIKKTKVNKILFKKAANEVILFMNSPCDFPETRLDVACACENDRRVVRMSKRPTLGSFLDVK
jgi:hypothetical protein